jgi:putative hydrolase of the HAD superfamily
VSSFVAAVIFDVDGTLVDHDRAQLGGLTTHLSQLGQRLDHDRWIRWRTLEEFHFARHLAGEIGFQEQRRRRVRDFTGEALDDVSADAWFDAYRVAFEASWTVFSDVAPTLEALAGHPLAAFSNVPGELTQHKLRSVGLADTFDVVLGTDDVGSSKPEAAAFASVCAALGVAASGTWHVGDRYLVDAIGARDAGLRSVWLNRPEADPLGRRPPGPAADDIPVVTSLVEFATLVDDDQIG